MTDRERKEIEAYIDLAIWKSIEAYKKSGLLKDSASMIYSEASMILNKYYQEGEKDTGVRAAIDCVVDDLYFAIIPMYFQEGLTIESIAEKFGVDVSTIVRNKKRLCVEVYANIS
jgi:DNA-directed RNA polymerase specialized sigma subunit